MSVKCLTVQEKHTIAFDYKNQVYSTDELALQFNVSPRTINRVLLERGVARTPKNRPVKVNKTVKPSTRYFMPGHSGMASTIKQFFKSIYAQQGSHDNPSK